jgi:hypothetical protein
MEFARIDDRVVPRTAICAVRQETFDRGIADIPGKTPFASLGYRPRLFDCTVDFRVLSESNQPRATLPGEHI